MKHVLDSELVTLHRNELGLIRQSTLAVSLYSHNACGTEVLLLC